MEQILKKLKNIFQKEPLNLKKNYKDIESRLDDLHSRFEKSAIIQMGNDSKYITAGKWIELGDNVYASRCSLSDDEHTALDVLFKPSGNLPTHFHTNREETIFVTNGRIKNETNNKVYKTNDICVIPKGEPHTITSDIGATLKIIFKPAYSDEVENYCEEID